MSEELHVEPATDSIDQITKRVFGCAFTVSNELGCGFLEKVYENALAHEVRKHGLEVKQQTPIKVRYDNVVVGDYVADLVIANQVVIEVKACSGIDDIHKAQCLNYLRATGMKVCLLINRGRPKIEIKRFIL